MEEGGHVPEGGGQGGRVVEEDVVGERDGWVGDHGYGEEGGVG